MNSLDDFSKLKDGIKEIKIIETEDSISCKSDREEKSEFFRNILISNHLKRTLEIF